jgi:hypothetical protein
MTEIDYKKFYDAEGYLLDEVGKRFREAGKLEAFDFYTLLIWKAARAKNYHRDRLKEKAGSFEAAVHKIAEHLHASSDRKQRLKILMEAWDFHLPTATAILTILDPDTFTVYDRRVCKEVRREEHYKRWCSRPFSEELWTEYESFKQAVINETPPGLTLREKDQFLFGRSTLKDIERDCKK